ARGGLRGLAGGEVVGGSLAGSADRGGTGGRNRMGFVAPPSRWILGRMVLSGARAVVEHRADRHGGGVGATNVFAAGGRGCFHRTCVGAIASARGRDCVDRGGARLGVLDRTPQRRLPERRGDLARYNLEATGQRARPRQSRDGRRAARPGGGGVGGVPESVGGKSREQRSALQSPSHAGR